MRVSKRATIIVLALTALFFALTLLHASWLADAPEGGPKLVADKGVAPVLGTRRLLSADQCRLWCSRGRAITDCP